MKKLSVLLGALVFLVIISGCQREEKKPTPKKAPAKFSYETISYKNAPADIKKLVEQNKTKESFIVEESHGTFYAVITRGTKPTQGYEVKITGVTQKVNNDANILQIKVSFIDPSPEDITAQNITNPFTIAKISVPQIPSGLMFLVAREQKKSAKPTREAEPGENIRISSPKPGDTVTSPVSVTGQARVFEATLQVELKDNSGKSLAQQTVMATEGAPSWGNFTALLNFTKPAQPVEGVIEAYTFSPRDGSKENVVQVPVTIK